MLRARMRSERARNPDQAGGMARAVVDHELAHVRSEARAVLAADLELAAPGARALHGLHDLARGGAVLGVNRELGYGPADGFGAAPSVEARGRVVPVGDLAAIVGRDDRADDARALELRGQVGALAPRVVVVGEGSSRAGGRRLVGPVHPAERGALDELRGED